MAFQVWNPDWFPLPGQAVFDRQLQQIAVVSRAPGNLDLFVIGFDNHVWSTFWNDRGGWNGDWFPLPGQAVFDHEHQQIAAVSRAPGNLDLFVIGFDNHVWSTFWNDQGGWNGDWFPLPGQAVFDHEHQQIAAVSRAPGNLDLFVIGFDNHVWSTFWNDQGGWNGDWFPLPGQAVFDHEHQQIAAVSRAPGNLDLFVIGFDNHVWSTFWNDRGGWNGDWFPLPGQAVFDHEHQQIAAVSRAPGNLDLFVIGFDNHVWSTFWNDRGGWNGDWFPLPGQAVFDRQLQQIAAVSRAPGNLDLFVIGFDNHVWSTFWNDQGGWNGDWFPLPGQAVFDRQLQQIAAVSRAPGNLDLFVIGFDNHVWSTFWPLTAQQCITVHFKSVLQLTQARLNYLADQYAAMEELYIGGGNIGVMRGTTEDLSGDATLTSLQNLNVGSCVSGSTTGDQNTLFAHRNNAGSNDIVVYLVSSLIGGTGNFVGCAAHPANEPACAVVEVDSARWLTAHEVGHVLGLSHVTNSDRLMNPSIGWTNLPPDLIDSEYQTMLDSSLTTACP